MSDLICTDCEDALATKEWRNSPEAVWWMCGRLPAVERLCAECWRARDNYEPGDKPYDPIGFLEDTYRREEAARRLKG